MKTKTGGTRLKTDKLRFFRNSLIKRFPDKSSVDIDIAIERALETMNPSQDRTRLNRTVIALLSGPGLDGSDVRNARTHFFSGTMGSDQAVFCGASSAAPPAADRSS